MSTMESTAGGGKKPREVNDFYRSPPNATHQLLTVERFYGAIHEPACGDGAISRVLEATGHSVFSSDLIDRGYGVSGWDFLKSAERPKTNLPGFSRCDTLITNPPFCLADEFAIHALGLGYSHIALFLRLAWLEGAARHKKLFAHRPPSRVWVFSRRQTLWRGDEVSPGKGGTIAFAWMVWQRNHAGTQMGWLP